MLDPNEVTILQAPEFSINHNKSLTLDGSLSYDPDIWDHIASYVWSVNPGNITVASGVTSGPLWEVPVLTIPYATLVGDGLVPGTIYTLGLAVTDTNGLTGTASVPMELYPNRPPIVVLDAPWTIGKNGTINFNSTGTYDPDGDAVVNYVWEVFYNSIWHTLDLGQRVGGTVQSPTFNWAYLTTVTSTGLSAGQGTGGDFTIRLSVQDDWSPSLSAYGTGILHLQAHYESQQNGILIGGRRLIIVNNQIVDVVESDPLDVRGRTTYDLGISYIPGEDKIIRVTPEFDFWLTITFDSGAEIKISGHADVWNYFYVPSLFRDDGETSIIVVTPDSTYYISSYWGDAYIIIVKEPGVDAYITSSHYEYIPFGIIYVYGIQGWFEFTELDQGWYDFTPLDWYHFTDVISGPYYWLTLPFNPAVIIDVTPNADIRCDRYFYVPGITAEDRIKVTPGYGVVMDHWFYTPSLYRDDEATSIIVVTPLSEYAVIQWIYGWGNVIINVIPNARLFYFNYIPSLYREDGITSVILVIPSTTVDWIRYIYGDENNVVIHIGGQILIDRLFYYVVDRYPGDIDVIPNALTDRFYYIPSLYRDDGKSIIIVNPVANVDWILYNYGNGNSIIRIGGEAGIGFIYVPSLYRDDETTSIIVVSGTVIIVSSSWTYVPSLYRNDGTTSIIIVDGSLTFYGRYYLYNPDTSKPILVTPVAEVWCSHWEYVPSLYREDGTTSIIIIGGTSEVVSSSWTYIPSLYRDDEITSVIIVTPTAIVNYLHYLGSAIIIVTPNAIFDRYIYIPSLYRDDGTTSIINVIPNIGVDWIQYIYGWGNSVIVVTPDAWVFCDRWFYVPGIAPEDWIKVIPHSDIFFDHWVYVPSLYRSDEYTSIIIINSTIIVNFVTHWEYWPVMGPHGPIAGYPIIIIAGIWLHYSNEDPFGPTHYPPKEKHYVYIPTGLREDGSAGIIVGGMVEDIVSSAWTFWDVSASIIVTPVATVDWIHYIYGNENNVIIIIGGTDNNIVSSAWQYTSDTTKPIEVIPSYLLQIHYQYYPVFGVSIVIGGSILVNWASAWTYNPTGGIIIGGTVGIDWSTAWLYDPTGGIIVIPDATVDWIHYIYGNENNVIIIIGGRSGLVASAWQYTSDTTKPIKIIPSYLLQIHYQYYPVFGVSIVIGGTVLVDWSSAWIYNSIGGIIIGGTVEIDWATAWLYDPTGGIIVIPDATLDWIHGIWNPDGGIIIGGEAIVLFANYLYNPTGGIIIVGEAIVAAFINFYYVPTGGIIVIPDATLDWIHGIWYPDGEIIIGGTIQIDFVTDWWYWTNGGIIIGGTAIVGRTYTPTGGIIIGGTAIIVNRHIPPPSHTGYLCLTMGGYTITSLCLVGAQVGPCPMTLRKEYSPKQKRELLLAEKLLHVKLETHYYAISQAFVAAMTICQIQQDVERGRRPIALAAKCIRPALEIQVKKSFKKASPIR